MQNMIKMHSESGAEGGRGRAVVGQGWPGRSPGGRGCSPCVEHRRAPRRAETILAKSSSPRSFWC